MFGCQQSWYLLENSLQEQARRKWILQRWVQGSRAKHAPTWPSTQTINDWGYGSSMDARRDPNQGNSSSWICSKTIKRQPINRCWQSWERKGEAKKTHHKKNKRCCQKWCHWRGSQNYWRSSIGPIKRTPCLRTDLLTNYFILLNMQPRYDWRGPYWALERKRKDWAKRKQG